MFQAERIEVGFKDGDKERGFDPTKQHTQTVYRFNGIWWGAGALKQATGYTASFGTLEEWLVEVGIPVVKREKKLTLKAWREAK